ncbi:hypothetical protein B6D52_01380 [Candidatus Parcubacteria bacterium 4484_255]|nr:MAG: hypothetical protein B6D52_01380 [Candidatus Parcubacteria bacterium 4484_255]
MYILSKTLIVNNMLNFKTIFKIFSDFHNNTSITLESDDKLSHLIRLNIETNRKLWDLEDSVRITELGLEHIAITKQKIDKNNQIRNNLIRKIDTEIANQMRVTQFNSHKQFYGESPGMIIDRLSILYIKLSVIKDLLSVIKEENLKKEYREKEDIILRQVNHLGNFLDFYFNKLKNKKIFFEIQQPVKIYNDNRIKKYIKLLQSSKNNNS